MTGTPKGAYFHSFFAGFLIVLLFFYSNINASFILLYCKLILNRNANIEKKDGETRGQSQLEYFVVD